MIGKVCARGRHVQGLLYYLFTEGRAGEKHLSSDHHEPRVIAGFDDPALLQPGARADGRQDFRRLAGLLTQPLKLAGVGPDDRPVYHLVASAAKDPETGRLRDRLLSDAEWADLHQLGFATRNDDAGVRWVAVRHADDHIHIVATLARQTGKRVHAHNDYYTVRRASHTIERRYGLVSTAPADRTATPRPTRAETEKLARAPTSGAQRGQGGPRLTDRERLRRHVRVAAAGSRTLPQFLAHLENEGVLTRLRYSERNPEQVTGYAVALPDDSGRPRVWFGGGKLAPDLTLPALEHRFASHAAYGVDADGREGLARGPQRTPSDPRLDEVRARLQARVGDPQECSGGAQCRAWKHASIAAAFSTEYLATHAHSDPAGAADAAWAAADLMHVSARIVDGPAGDRLTQAAEAYERAARIQYRHRPAPTYAGYRLRKASALLLDTALTAGIRRSNPQLAALLTQIAHLARTLSELREAQLRLHQAKRARAAAGRTLLAAAAARGDVEPSTTASSTQELRQGSQDAQRLPTSPRVGVPSAPSTAATWRPASGPPGPVWPRSRSR